MLGTSSGYKECNWLSGAWTDKMYICVFHSYINVKNPIIPPNAANRVVTLECRYTRYDNLLLVIFDEKNIQIGVWFSCNISGFLAIGMYTVTYGAGEKSCCQWCRFSYLWCYCLCCNLVIKSKSSCQWCTLAFGAVTTVHPYQIDESIFNFSGVR